MPGIDALHQAAVPSRDLARSIAFYRDQLGLRLLAKFEPPGLAFFALGNTRLLVDAAASEQPGGGALYFRVPDLHAACETLRARGVAIESGPHAIHSRRRGHVRHRGRRGVDGVLPRSRRQRARARVAPAAARESIMPRALALALSLAAALACGARGDAQDVEVASGVATEFLRELDAGAATETWPALASPLRASAPEPSWPAQVARMRAPLGRARSRQLASALFTETLPGAPNGRYFVVEFESQFERAACGERVVAMFEHGTWRVAGYVIHGTRLLGARGETP